MKEPVLDGEVVGICILCDRQHKKMRVDHAYRHIIVIHLLMEHNDKELEFLGLEREQLKRDLLNGPGKIKSMTHYSSTLPSSMQVFSNHRY